MVSGLSHGKVTYIHPLSRSFSQQIFQCVTAGKAQVQLIILIMAAFQLHHGLLRCKPSLMLFLHLCFTCYDKSKRTLWESTHGPPAFYVIVLDFDWHLIKHPVSCIAPVTATYTFPVGFLLAQVVCDLILFPA